MGTTKKPPNAPSNMRNGAATQTLSMKFMPITKMPMPMPSGITRVAWCSFMRMEATTAPTAVPMATTPTKLEAWVVEYPKAAALQAKTM